MKAFSVVFLGVFVASVVAMLLFVAKIPHSVVGGDLLGAGLPDVGQRFSTAASASKEHTIKAASSRLFSCYVKNDNSLNQNTYFQLFDMAEEPHYDSVPVYSFSLPASTTLDGWFKVDSAFFAPAARFDTGLTYGISSDDDTYSSASINEINYDVFCQYE